MSTWLRLYTSVLDDPKVQKLPPEQLMRWSYGAAGSLHGSLSVFPMEKLNAMELWSGRFIAHCKRKGGALSDTPHRRFTELRAVYHAGVCYNSQREGSYESNSPGSIDRQQRHTVKRRPGSATTDGAGERLCKQRVCAAVFAPVATQNTTGAINRQASRATDRNRAAVARQPQRARGTLRASPGRTSGRTGEEFSASGPTSRTATHRRRSTSAQPIDAGCDAACWRRTGPRTEDAQRRRV